MPRTIEIGLSRRQNCVDCANYIQFNITNSLLCKFNFCRYSFDMTRCMFSAGNVTEKLRVASFDCRGEVIVDIYAGMINSDSLMIVVQDYDQFYNKSMYVYCLYIIIVLPTLFPFFNWSVTHRSTTTSHISGTSIGCGFRKEYNFDWPYTFSAAITTWRLHTSSAIFSGLTKQSHCDDYGPALNSAWLYLKRGSEPSVTDLSVWRLLVHRTVFQPVSLQLLPWLSSKDKDS